MAVRQSDSDGHADGWSGLSYRWSGVDGWSDGHVFRLDKRSDDGGQPDGHGRMEYRRSDAQAVCKEYSEYMTTAYKGVSEKRKLTQYVTNTELPCAIRHRTLKNPNQRLGRKINGLTPKS